MVEGRERHGRPIEVDHAALRARAIDAGGWFAPYLVGVAVLSTAYVVLLEAVVGSGWARLATGVAWAAMFLAGHYWGERQDVHPAGGARMVAVAFAVWFVAYLVVLGPLVRWWFGDSLLAWSVASAVMATPFLVAAARVATRR